VLSKAALRMSVAGVMVALPLAFAGVASAATGPSPSLVHPMNGTECSGNVFIGDDTDATKICTEVNGSGLRVNWIVVKVSDYNNPPASTDNWFPTYSGCTVQASWMLWNNAGNSNYNNTSPSMSCSEMKSNGGWQDDPERTLEAGELCSYLTFNAFGQYSGGNCVGVHS
jgi:hypothetical protein